MQVQDRQAESQWHLMTVAKHCASETVADLQFTFTQKL